MVDECSVAVTHLNPRLGQWVRTRVRDACSGGRRLSSARRRLSFPAGRQTVVTELCGYFMSHQLQCEELWFFFSVLQPIYVGMSSLHLIFVNSLPTSS